MKKEVYISGSSTQVQAAEWRVGGVIGDRAEVAEVVDVTIALSSEPSERAVEILRLVRRLLGLMNRRGDLVLRKQLVTIFEPKRWRAVSR